MEKSIAKSNVSKWHQCEGGSKLLEPQFTSSLGYYGEGPEIKDILNGTFQYPSNTSTVTKDFLQAFIQPSNIYSIP